ncbi:MAG: hypothetical protein GF350_00280 [Chitinivibrionales bacterium]|nr:hypothetical protein [Chitinivibrionales bacterium]
MIFGKNGPVCVVWIVCVLAAGAMAGNSFQGTWCVDEQDLTIRFHGKDSLKVRSSDEEGVSGAGSYSVKDSLLSATIRNGELKIEMGYRYSWETDSIVRARISFITINGDSVEHPTEWMNMQRCDTGKAGATDWPADRESGTPAQEAENNNEPSEKE